MIKNLLCTVLCLTVAGVCAQDGTGSPYSYFGIGENRSLGTMENQMMGGIGVYTDSIHLNLRNPASYGLLGLESVENGKLVVYSAGATHIRRRIDNFTDEQNSTATVLDYISIGFNLGKGFGVGFGIKPYTLVDYNLVSETTNASGALVQDVYSGDGGLSTVYFSAGYKIVKDLSVGVTANLNFGNIEKENFQTVENVQLGTREFKKSQIRGMDFNYAIQYNPKLNSKYRLYSSARAHTQANLSSQNTRVLSSINLNTGQTIEEVDVDLDATGERRTEIKIPTTFSVGLGVGVDRKWFLGAEYDTQSYEDLYNPFLQDASVIYQNANRVALGGFIIPDYDAFTGYFKRVTYRAGVYMGNSGMVLNDKEIKNLGITFGVGLPLGRSLPNINIGFELGKKGTSTADLVEENYAKINIGFSFNDFWFRKRKIN